MGATSNSESRFRDLLANKSIPVLLVITLLVLGFLGWVYWQRFERIFALQAEIAELKRARDDLEQDISSLRSELTRRNDVAYIEKLAREELGLVYPSSEEGQKSN